ncbi:MAG: DUF5615 family PIN-like protein [Anaerolineae bacterium]
MCSSGYDVLIAREAGLLEAADETQLAFAAEQRRALVSHNVKHYPELHVGYLQQDKEHSGIILCQQRDVGTLQRWLKIFLNRYTFEDMRSQILFLGKWIEAG